MISTSQKEHLMYSLILQVTILLGIAIFAWYYIFPGITEINATVATTQQTVDTYNTTKKDGLTFDTLGQELGKLKGKEELIKIIQALPEDTKKVIAKTGNEDYLTWLINAIAASGEDKKKLIQAKQKINSILPTMSPISDSIDQDYITLKEYTKFIETQFLSQFQLDSNVVLGIQGISYNQDEKANNVGSFDLRLDFKATNTNIMKLISYVNNSGNPEILAYSGILTDDKIPKILSNPLITVEALSLENTLDPLRGDDINNGRIVIRFYVRGASQQDITFLEGSFTERMKNLKKQIKDATEECQKQDLLCPNLTKLQDFQRKFNEFDRSITNTKGITTDITILGQAVVSLRTLEDEFSTLVPQKK